MEIFCAPNFVKRWSPPAEEKQYLMPNSTYVQYARYLPIFWPWNVSVRNAVKIQQQREMKVIRVASPLHHFAKILHFMH